MWILQRLVVVLALAVVLLFGMLNAGEKVTVHYWFGYSFANSPLPLVMVTFFLIGVLFYYLFSIAREWRLRAEIRRLRRSARDTQNEIQQLRQISLEDDLGPEPEPPGDEERGP